MTETATVTTFSDLKGYRAAYAATRGEILVRHGHPADAKGVRLAAGCITLLVEIGGRMVPFTSDNTDARDRVALGGTFALRANV